MAMTLTQLNELFGSFGSRDKAHLRVGKKEYQATTVEEMRQQTIDRITETIDTINKFSDWNTPMKSHPLGAPMAKRELGGFRVKVGFGVKNESLGLEQMLYTMNRKSDEKATAIAELKTIEQHMKNGAFDLVFADKLTLYRERAALAKQAKSAKRDNVQQFARAA
jgi:hypothetical protein|tara:strand:- start:145 stop:639 length:495 start_codon:yes stop_codon:yes gene_type:complete